MIIYKTFPTIICEVRSQHCLSLRSSLYMFIYSNALIQCASYLILNMLCLLSYYNWIIFVFMWLGTTVLKSHTLSTPSIHTGNCIIWHCMQRFTPTGQSVSWPFAKEMGSQQPWLSTLTSVLFTKAAKITQNTWINDQPVYWIRRATVFLYKPRHLLLPKEYHLQRVSEEKFSKAIYIQVLTSRNDSSKVVQCGSSDRSTNSRGGL